jgi:hypothetical protein
MTDQDQHMVKPTRYRDLSNMESIMTKQPELVYCSERMINVDLKQEFHKCIEENQCFSDDPCPLSANFHRPPVQKDGAAPVTALVDFFRK